MKYPTIKQLRYFVALCEDGHFGRAAARSFVSQSAFSTAIKDLEVLLGTQLVDRTKRRVTVAPIGQEVATLARLCLRDVESLVEVAAKRSEPLAGPLRLGVIPTIAPFLLPVLMPKLRHRFPALKLYLVEEETARLHKRLLEGEIDLLLVALPYDLRSSETLPLFKDRFYLAARRGSALTDPGNYRFNRLAPESILLLEDGHCLRQHTLDACKIRKTEKVARFSASSLLTLVEMVDADLGITFLPEMAEGSALLRNTQVRLYPLAEKSYREIGLAWRKGSARGEEFRLLGKFIADECG